MDWLVVGLLVILVGIGVARYIAAGPRLSAPTGGRAPPALPPGAADQTRRLLDAATRMAGPTPIDADRLPGDGAAMLEAAGRFDPDIRRELEDIARHTEAMWQAFEQRFGHRGPPTGADEHAMADPVLAETTVRQLRAVDEQLRRLRLPPAPRPADWVRRCAAGRVPLPPAPWARRADPAEADPFGVLEPETLRRWQVEALRKAGGAVQRRLLKAVVQAMMAHPALGGVQIAPVPPSAGSHRAYRLAPVGARYIHLFPSEPLDIGTGFGDGTIADLVLVAGVRGHMFQNMVVRIDPVGRARAWREGRQNRQERQALEAAGYRVLALARREADRDMTAAADRICIAMAALFADHRAS